MKKIIFLTFCIVIILLAIGVFILETRKTVEVSPSITLPTPTPFTSSVVAPTRNPNILPEQFLQAEKDFIKQTPILQKLPAGSQFFSIEYVDEQHLIVHAKTTNIERDYEEAKAWFRQNTIDINTITVEYN